MGQILLLHDHHQGYYHDADHDGPWEIPPGQQQQAGAVADHAGSAEPVAGGDIVVFLVAEARGGHQNRQENPRIGPQDDPRDNGDKG